ncbi:MAG: hypothetical protein WC722_02075 [Rhodospirillales bacterium]
MSEQDQVLEFLARPESYGLAASEPVLRIDTHISAVFLAGDKAYKLKKSVKLPSWTFRPWRRGKNSAAPSWPSTGARRPIFIWMWCR